MIRNARSVTKLLLSQKDHESHKTMRVENWVVDLPDSEDYKIVNEVICFHLTLVMIGQGYNPATLECVHHSNSSQTQMRDRKVFPAAKSLKWCMMIVRWQSRKCLPLVKSSTPHGIFPILANVRSFTSVHCSRVETRSHHH